MPMTHECQGQSDTAESWNTRTDR